MGFVLVYCINILRLKWMHINCPLERKNTCWNARMDFLFLEAALSLPFPINATGISYLRQPVTPWIHSPGWFYVRSLLTATGISKCVLSCHRSRLCRKTESRILFMRSKTSQIYFQIHRRNAFQIWMENQSKCCMALHRNALLLIGFWQLPTGAQQVVRSTVLSDGASSIKNHTWGVMV